MLFFSNFFSLNTRLGGYLTKYVSETLSGNCREPTNAVQPLLGAFHSTAGRNWKKRVRVTRTERDTNIKTKIKTRPKCITNRNYNFRQGPRNNEVRIFLAILLLLPMSDTLSALDLRQPKGRCKVAVYMKKRILCFHLLLIIKLFIFSPTDFLFFFVLTRKAMIKSILKVSLRDARVQSSGSSWKRN